MANQRDYYEVLGIDRNADQDEIKRAYRNLARKYHPDVNKEPDADRMFKEINEANEVLSDENKRQVYDRYGHSAVNGAAGNAGYGGFNSAGMGNFGDIFDMFFGQGSPTGQRGVERGDDLRVDVTLTLEEVAFGTEREVQFTRLESCETCAGNGAKPGTIPETCKQCNGSGVVRHMQQTILGTFQSTTPCSKCRGEGRVITSPCATCNGKGLVRKSRTKTIPIRAGVDNGNRMRVPGEGDAGARGGHTGDLYVFINVREHEYFEREGNDIFCEVPISAAKAAIGGKITVKTLNGEEEITLAEGTQPGTRHRLRDKGIPDINGRGRGDQIVIVEVKIPTKLSMEQKIMLQKFAESTGETIDIPEEMGFFSRIFNKS